MDGVLADVHAARFENVVAYAVIRSGTLTTLGLEPLGRVSFPGDVGARLARFVLQNDLRLVHWRSRTLFPSAQAAVGYLCGTEANCT